MKNTTIRFKIPVDCSTYLKGEQNDIYYDYGMIVLPDNYTETGKPTRLVISCHGAGGTVTTNDSQVEVQTLTKYLVANGYAIMDVNGLPFDFATEYGIDVKNNIGSPIAIQSYVKAYNYCMENFNLEKVGTLNKLFIVGSETYLNQNTITVGNEKYYLKNNWCYPLSYVISVTYDGGRSKGKGFPKGTPYYRRVGLRWVDYGLSHRNKQRNNTIHI